MTKREVLKILERLKISSIACGAQSDNPTYEKATEALNVALAALRGPTREQVKNVWHGYHTSGCGVCLGSSPVGYGSNKKYGTYSVDLDGNDLHIMGSRIRINFCPKCGRVLTDDAVDIVMKRLEALHENDR